ncbi:hypothetical protein OAS86_04595 [Gammaproteobacteria bacterium]|nr:hypothetical protein [Gammaproteobacteria bacterium]
MTVIQRLIERINTLRELRAQRALFLDLNRLSDKALDDIGLSRSAMAATKHLPITEDAYAIALEQTREHNTLAPKSQCAALARSVQETRPIPQECHCFSERKVEMPCLGFERRLSLIS